MTEEVVWAAVRVPAYRQLFLSAAIVIGGVMAQAVARGWLARELTGSNLGLGGVMLVFGAVMLISTPFGGIAADRHSKRTVLNFAVIALLCSSLWIGVEVVIGSISYWMLLVASGIQAAAFAFYLPARVAFIAQLVPNALIENAVLTAQMAQEAARVIAPALAGVMIGVSWFGVGGVFLAAAGACCASLLLMLKLPPGFPRQQIVHSPWAEARNAVRYTRTTPGLGATALFTVGVVMVGFPYLTFMPALADDRFHAGALGYGVMSATAGLGALVAGVLDVRGDLGAKPSSTMTRSAIGLGASAAGLGIAPSFVAALVALFGIGACGLLFQTSSQALMLRMSEPEYHGRLQSFVIIGFSGFGLAALPLGSLADATSVGTILVLMGVIIFAMTAVFAVTRPTSARPAQASAESSRPGP